MPTLEELIVGDGLRAAAANAPLSPTSTVGGAWLAARAAFAYVRNYCGNPDLSDSEWKNFVYHRTNLCPADDLALAQTALNHFEAQRIAHVAREATSLQTALAVGHAQQVAPGMQSAARDEATRVLGPLWQVAIDLRTAAGVIESARGVAATSIFCSVIPGIRADDTAGIKALCEDIESRLKAASVLLAQVQKDTAARERAKKAN